MQYENIYISSFILTLGIYIGRNNLQGSFGMNLFQQTSTDTVLGDALQSIDGKHLLLEFKRSEKNIFTEYDKPRRVKFMEEIIKNKNRYFLFSSFQGHFLSYPFHQNNVCDFNFQPYLSISELYKKKEYQSIKNNSFNGIDNYLKGMLDCSSSLGLCYSEMRDYIDFMSSFSGDKKFSSGGILTTVSDKGIQCIEYKNFAELQHTLTQTVGMLQQKTIQKEIKKSKERGAGLSY